MDEANRERELIDDLPRQQAHEVRVARDTRVDPVERALGDRGAAQRTPALEHQAFAPGFRQVRGGRQPVVAAADDDGVVPAGNPRHRSRSIAPRAHTIP